SVLSEHDPFANAVIVTSPAAAPDDPGDPNFDVEVLIEIELIELPSTGGAPVWDLHPEMGERTISLIFKPRTQEARILGVDEFFRCAGGIEVAGDGSDGTGGRAAQLVLDVSASATLDPAGDSDQDGLLDSWEICGVGTLDLPSLGADPYRKDLFVEIDWMAELGESGHTHAPFLPALLAAWHELDRAPIANIAPGREPRRSGIALHVDVGSSLSGRQAFLDFDGDGSPELVDLSVDLLDLDGDGVPDIGDLALLSSAERPGGEEIQEIGILDVSSGSLLEAIRGEHFAREREPIFHYALFAHAYTENGRFRGTGSIYLPELRTIVIATAGPDGGCADHPSLLGTDKVGR
ncbi:MAG TPA: hypothetical protein VK116_05370, partial [Planctomycetota bacterium]|nr:hypothetical protein [Planctomycetota bacterium]